MATGIHYVGLATALVGLLLIAHGAWTYRQAEKAPTLNAEEGLGPAITQAVQKAEELRSKHEIMLGCVMAIVGGGIAYVY